MMMMMMMILVFFTGEGKTLVAVLPIYLNALKKEGMIVLHDDDDNDHDDDDDDDDICMHFHHLLPSIYRII